MTSRRRDGKSPNTIESHIYATGDATQTIERWMGQWCPLLIPRNLAEFEDGKIGVARFDRGDKQFENHILRTTLRRAKNPDDPLYCAHAATDHSGTYLQALDALLERDAELKLSTRRISNDAPPHIRPRFAFIGERRERASLVPTPFKRYFELRGKPRTSTDYIDVLQNQSSIIANIITLICLGIHPDQILTCDETYERVTGGLLARKAAKDKLRAEVGKLKPDVYRTLTRLISTIYRTLIVNEMPSYKRDVYQQVLDAINLSFPKLTNSADFDYISYNHLVTPLAVLRTAAEVVLHPTLGAPRSQGTIPDDLESILMAQPTTSLVTAYFHFH